MPVLCKERKHRKIHPGDRRDIYLGANSFADLGDIAAGFRKVKDDNIARGMETLNPIYKLFMWMTIVHKFAEKILVFEKA